MKPTILMNKSYNLHLQINIGADPKVSIVLNAQASPKNQKVALLVAVLRGAFLGTLALWFLMNFGTI